MRLRFRRLLVAALPALALGACAGRSPAVGEAGAAPDAASPAPRRAPLAPFRGQPLVVTPVQRLTAVSELGWNPPPGEPRALDSALADSARARGVTGWAFAREVESMARRNPTLALDPHTLAVDELLLGKRQPEQLGGQLATQLRALVALGGQRYVLVPAQLSYTRRVDGRGEAVLRLVLVDARASRPLWTGELRSAPAETFSPATLASIAGQFADLIAPPVGAPGP